MTLSMKTKGSGRPWLAVAFLCLPMAAEAARQPGKDGPLTVAANTVVNLYGTLAADAPAGSLSLSASIPAGGNTLDPSTLTANDLLLVIQMQGASIDSTNTVNYGNVTNYNNAGRWEFVTVSGPGVGGPVYTIPLAGFGLKNSYTALGSAQVIRVPQYSTLTVNGGVAIQARNWGAGSVGGVIAVDVQGTATLNGDLDAGARGFRGGALTMAASVGSSIYRGTNALEGAEKGESIAGTLAVYDTIGGRYGRGAPANGGGGGNGHDAAGGGGANASNGVVWNGRGNPDRGPGNAYDPAWNLDPTLNALTTSSGGGRGGYSYSDTNRNALTEPPGNPLWGGDFRREVGGLGGHPSSYGPALRQLFMGGGGGAGAQTNANAGAGGRGGGLVFLYASTVTGGGRILASGAAGGSTTGNHEDAPGGAGGGGAVVVQASTGVTLGQIRADGGAGGSQSTPVNFPSEAQGGGGGGGGGYIHVCAPTVTIGTRTANGGVNGTTGSTSLTEFPPNGGTRGAPGNASAGANCIGAGPPALTFTDVSTASGLNVGGGKTGGVAWGDFNNDTCPDALVNTTDPVLTTRIYAQDKSGAACLGTFVDVTTCLAGGLLSNVRDRAVAWGDFDNDGDLDFARSQNVGVEVYKNGGPGAACAVGGSTWSRFGVVNGGDPNCTLGGCPNQNLVPGNAEGIGWIDFDQDGDLDLFIENGDGMIMATNGPIGTLVLDTTTGLPVAGSGNGDYSAVADYDVDGDVDVLARKDDGRDLWWNDGTAPTFFAQNLNFTQAAAGGTSKGGVAFCDFDGDGDFDVFWTDFPTGVNQIWRNNGGVNGAVTWTAMGTLPTGVSDVDGASCGDLDHDGDVDLMLNAASGLVGDFLFRNDGGFTFVNAPPAGFGTSPSPAGALADYDRDGDLDLLVNQDGNAQLWRNEANDQNYLMVRAVHDVGVAERDAIGATVTLGNCSGTPVSPVKEVSGGSGHGSQDSALVHFGLRRATAPTGPGSVYVVRVKFVGGGIVERAVVPSALGCYQMVTIKNTDPTNLNACTPTAVELASFTAAGSDGALDLAWTTASEISNLGFHLHRSTSSEGPWTRITSSLIPGLGSSATGASYAFRDSGLANGTTYHYELEDVERTGKTERHGPVSATPQPSSGGGGDGAGGSGGESGDSGGEDGSSSGRITWGDPAGASLRILERGPSHVVLELLTPGFTARTQSDGTLGVSIPGFEDAALPGDLAVPVRHALVEALAGRRARLGSVTAEDIVSFDAFRLAAAGTRDLVVREDGTLRTGTSPRRLLESNRRSGFAPRTWARLLGPLFQGETKKAQVELAPLRHDPVSGRTVLARRLVVRVEFAGADRSERSLGGSRGRKPPALLLPRKGVFAQLVVRAPGLHRLRFEDQDGPVRRGLDARSLRLSRLGQAVPYHLEPDRALFAPGSSLFFLVKDDPSLHDRGEAVYELALGQSASRMAVISGTPSGPQTTEYLHSLTLEQNKFYQSALLQAPDLWLWDLLLSPVTKSYPFTLDSVSPSTTSSHLRVVLQGASDFEEVDHHVRVSLNGIPVGETTWDGKVEQVFEADVTPGVLVEGTNTLALENVGDAGAAYSMVFLNRFEVTHPRGLTPSSGRLEGRFEQSGRAYVPGLGTSGAAYVVDKTAAPIWLRSPEATPTGLAFRAEVGKSYLAVSETSVLAPEVRKTAATSLRSASNRASWVLIGPREFLPAARPLLDLRRSQGLLARSVALEDVYSEFGFGEQGSKPIHDFLSFAFHNWKTPPRYVVLLGDSTYDPRDYLKTGVKDRVPTPIVETTYLWTASDPTLAAVNGEDALPDLAIGRLSAGTLEQAQRLVDKLVAFEQAGRTFNGMAILVADNADLAGNFEANQDEIASSVLPGRELEKLYLRDLGASLRSEILAAFDNGPGLVSYVGHGATAVWASENVWNNQDVASLQPQAQQPLLLTLNCLNGFFHFPPLDSLAEALVKAEGKGALAAFSPSGLSVNDAAHLYHKALLTEIASQAHVRLGDAVLAAQQDYANQGAMPELLSIYHLLGDPGMRIR